MAHMVNKPKRDITEIWWCLTMTCGWWKPGERDRLRGGSAGCNQQCGYFREAPLCQCTRGMCEANHEGKPAAILAVEPERCATCFHWTITHDEGGGKCAKCPCQEYVANV